jgi:hypothetical protein
MTTRPDRPLTQLKTLLTATKPTGGENQLVTTKVHGAQQRDNLGTNNHLKPPRLPIKVRLPELLRTHEPLSLSYDLAEASHEVNFGSGIKPNSEDNIVIAKRKSPNSSLVMIRRIRNTNNDFDAELLGNLRGEHFWICLEICEHGGGFNLIFEYMELSLVQILGTPLRRTDKEVAAIAAQVRSNFQQQCLS